jgi:hypothetical protein
VAGRHDLVQVTIKMKDGRMLTTLVKTGKWLADTIWFK